MESPVTMGHRTANYLFSLITAVAQSFVVTLNHAKLSVIRLVPRMLSWDFLWGNLPATEQQCTLDETSWAHELLT